MSQKPENTFIGSVHKYLPLLKDLYRAKMNNPYTAGLPDWWYSGKKDLWVEYKYLPKLPKRGSTVIIPYLSELQRQWVNGRYDEGRNVHVIVGHPRGGAIFSNKQWNQGFTTVDFLFTSKDREGLASWIKNQVQL